MPSIDDLAALPPLADVPRDQLQWLIDHGEFRRVADGDVLRAVGADIEGLFVVVSGRFSVRVEQGGVEREVREVTAGQVTGYLPYSRLKTARGYLVADGPVEFLAIRIGDFPRMTSACYEFTGLCVQAMLERVRVFKSDDKRQERMAALGRLSAGLAHELNNPASAAARAARELESAQADVVAAARALGSAGLTGEALEAVETLAAAAGRRGVSWSSPIERSAMEDRLTDWLDERDIDADLAYPLVDCGVTVADLETAASAVEAGQLAIVLRYVAATSAVHLLTADINTAVERIHALVATVKKHTHMDRAAALEPIRLEPHLADTVTLMSSKAAARSASVELTIEADLPLVEGFVSDLNQVWMHLVDNAIDALDGPGRILVDARRARHGVMVCVTDDGRGIPRELHERVFEPFFTTKDFGEGRGLGLDVVRTVIRNHRGTVELSSVPGHTEFRVTLPAMDFVAPA